MLTKELLEYRILKGRVRPTFVDPMEPGLLPLAESLCAIPTGLPDAERGDLEEALDGACAGFERPRVAAGLKKLLLDRLTFEPPDDSAVARREALFTETAHLFRALPDGTTPEQWEIVLETVHGDTLETTRDTLYADHPEHRRLTEFDTLTGRELLDRYNLALVQGLAFRATKLTLTAAAADVLQVRRVLRWLKWCRLVADVKDDHGTWTIEVEGPAAILDMQRKYGLQLAQFVAVVPVLDRWKLQASVKFEKGRPAALELDETSPLVSPHDRALGHVPEEIAVITQKLADGKWTIDDTPRPRRVGTSGLCVPDLLLHHKAKKVDVAVEFFHRWHKHALAKRLKDLKIRPDPTLFLAVDEALLGDDTLTRADAEEHPQVLLFKGFPSERKLRAILATFE